MVIVKCSCIEARIEEDDDDDDDDDDDKVGLKSAKREHSEQQTRPAIARDFKKALQIYDAINNNNPSPVHF